MKNKIKIAAIALLFVVNSLQSQTVGMDFNKKDCDGNIHGLFADLNSGKVVIIEYVMMSCGGCVVAGNGIEPMKANLLTQYPGKIKTYAISFNNSTSCSTLKNWVTTNAFTSIPMDSGATQVAYYGGMGMPTIVILGGGNTHSVLGTPYVGFTISDTTAMASSIRNSLNRPTSVKENKSIVNELKIFPNPANNEFKISLQLKESVELKIDILDLTGRIVLKMLDEKVSTGNFNKAFNTTSLAEGNYIVRITAGESISKQKINVVR